MTYKDIFSDFSDYAEHRQKVMRSTTNSNQKNMPRQKQYLLLTLFINTLLFVSGCDLIFDAPGMTKFYSAWEPLKLTSEVADKI